jgi:hypothetical protein
MDESRVSRSTEHERVIFQAYLAIMQRVCVTCDSFTGGVY